MLSSILEEVVDEDNVEEVGVEIEEDEDFEDDFEDTGIFGLKDKYDAFKEKMASKKVERELKKYSKDREIDEFEYDEPKNLFSKKASKNTHVLEDSEEDTKSKLQSGITSMFSKIKSDLFPVLATKDKFDLEGKKQQAKEYIESLMKPTEAEMDYMERFIAKEYKPELLFEDTEIVERIRNHPMALWKCK